MMTEEQKQDLAAECRRTIVDAEKPGAGYRTVARGEIARIALAALTQPVSPALKLPDGWVAVPLEPTEGMIAAWRDDMDKSYAKEHAIKIGEDEIVFAHQAMLAAAPAVPHTAPIEPICATGGAEWVKVPREPTRQMMSQGHFAMAGTDRGKFRRIYQAMIAAAPQPE